jgi:hypothetical protein
MTTLVQDFQVDALINLPVDQKRDLIKWGAALPDRSRRGPGGGREWSRRTFRRLARIRALNATGLSLRMSLAYLYMLDERFDLIDPDASPEFDNKTWAELQRWFEPDFVSGEQDSDLHLFVVDGKFVFQGIQFHDESELVATGILEAGGTIFRTGIDFANPLARGRAQWQRPDGSCEIDPESLAWRFDPDMKTNDFLQCFSCPVSLLKVNLTLATLRAMRGLLGLPLSHSQSDAAARPAALRPNGMKERQGPRLRTAGRWEFKATKA